MDYDDSLLDETIAEVLDLFSGTSRCEDDDLEAIQRDISKITKTISVAKELGLPNGVGWFFSSPDNWTLVTENGLRVMLPICYVTKNGFELSNVYTSSGVEKPIRITMVEQRHIPIDGLELIVGLYLIAVDVTSGHVTFNGLFFN